MGRDPWRVRTGNKSLHREIHLEDVDWSVESPWGETPWE